MGDPVSTGKLDGDACSSSLGQDLKLDQTINADTKLAKVIPFIPSVRESVQMAMAA